MASNVRQRYSLATGGGLQQAASGPGTTPKYARGGAVKRDPAKGTSGTVRVHNDYRGRPPGDKPGMARGGAVGSSASFKRGVNVTGRPGDDKFTSVTQKQVAKGFKVQRP